MRPPLTHPNIPPTFEYLLTALQIVLYRRRILRERNRESREPDFMSDNPFSCVRDKDSAKTT